MVSKFFSKKGYCGGLNTIWYYLIKEGVKACQGRCCRPNTTGYYFITGGGKMKPIIGITCNYDHRGTIGTVTNSGPDDQDWSFVAVDYVRAVETAGGIPVTIPQFDDPAKALGVLERLDGLLISGGNDVAPEFYGEAIRDCSGLFFPMRDVLEIGLVKEAVKLKKPLLGICRGLQILNTAFGGTIYQDLRENGDYGPHMVIAMPKHLPSHSITLAEGSQIRAIYDNEEIRVNSFHHQAVHVLPDNAKVGASAPDGLVECVEYSGGHPFTIGVQWHPEMMQQSDDDQKRIFQALVAACGK